MPARAGSLGIVLLEHGCDSHIGDHPHTLQIAKNDSSPVKNRIPRSRRADQFFFTKSWVELKQRRASSSTGLKRHCDVECF